MQQAVLDALKGLPLEVTTGRALSSVTAVLRGAREGGPVVPLRGDMDGLPVTEDTGLEYASEIPRAMHACGHDLHTAMLVGAARLLSAHRAELPGDVVFMFQPGEEGHDGGGLMVREGVLDAAGRRVASAYGMHVFSAQFPRGVLTTRPRTLMAASDGLRVTVRGRGGHGSMPYLSRDPVTTAAQMVTALQTMVTRRFDVFDPVVVTVGTFHAGTRRNIIPPPPWASSVGANPPKTWTSGPSAASPCAVRRNYVFLPLYTIGLVLPMIVGFAGSTVLKPTANSNGVLLDLAGQAFPSSFVGAVVVATAASAMVPAAGIIIGMTSLISRNIIPSRARRHGRRRRHGAVR